jgi:hypothetical protein
MAKYLGLEDTDHGFSSTIIMRRVNRVKIAGKHINRVLFILATNSVVLNEFGNTVLGTIFPNKVPKFMRLIFREIFRILYKREVTLFG